MAVVELGTVLLIEQRDAIARQVRLRIEEFVRRRRDVGGVLDWSHGEVEMLGRLLEAEIRGEEGLPEIDAPGPALGIVVIGATS